MYINYALNYRYVFICRSFAWNELLFSTQEGIKYVSFFNYLLTQDPLMFVFICSWVVSTLENGYRRVDWLHVLWRRLLLNFQNSSLPGVVAHAESRESQWLLGHHRYIKCSWPALSRLKLFLKAKPVLKTTTKPTRL